MKKQFCLLLLVLFFISCKDQPVVEEFQPLPSTKTDLVYPTGSGHSGETRNGLVGYGYDATGFCDTISVRAKVLELLPDGDLSIGNPNTTFPTLVSGSDFTQFLVSINNPNFANEYGALLASHLKSLLKLASKSDTIDSKSAYVYYAITYYNAHSGYFYGANTKNYVTSDFKKDVVALTANALVAKYGTHVLANVFEGTKFEVLYRFKSDNLFDEYLAKAYFQERMKEYVGGIPMYINTDIKAVTKKIKTDEQFIYNSIGSRKKLCGVITSTDYNPDSITLDVNEVFKTGVYKPQFIAIGENGIIPIYDLISDETKKQEVKAYIEKYLITTRN